jgi:hypothetical protein
MDTSNANPALFAALAAAQGEIENAAKNAANPHFRSKYADLAEVLNTTREVFPKHGLSLLQSTGFDGSLVSVTTLLAHKDGGYITAVASCVPAKTDAQGVGSATTYLRRYSAAAIAGIAQEDDDGNAAAHNGKPAPVTKVNPTTGAWESQSPESQEYLSGIATHVIELLTNASEADAWDYLHTQSLDSDEKIALWTRFDSKQRAALKRGETQAKRAA